MLTKRYLAVASAILASSVALAAGGSDRFARLDANGDGSIARTEVQAAAKSRFERIDGDRDGFVTATELTTQREARQAKRDVRAARERSRGGNPARRLERLDTDRDGRLSLAEFVVGPDRRFDRLDRDRDGSVSRADVEAARAIRAARQQ